MIFIMILICLMSLFIGYLLGVYGLKSVLNAHKYKNQIKKQKKEIENFLNYDGSEQS